MRDPQWMEGDDIALGLVDDEEEFDDGPDRLEEMYMYED